MSLKDSIKFDYDSASDIPVGDWRWPSFDPGTEWADKLTGRIVYVPDFMDRLQALRTAVGVPLPMTSGYRTPAHDQAVGTSATPGSGPHTTGLACDIALTNPQLGLVITEAIALGFTGFGLQQKDGSDPKGRFLHLDALHDTLTFWSY